MIKNLITVVISAYNEERKIRNCLKALLNQTYKPLEIIVVNNGSTDNTERIVNELINKNSSIKMFKRKNKALGPAPAKNLGAKEAKGKILVFVDADEYVKEDYIEKITKPIRNKKTKTAIGSWYVAQSKNPWARCRFPNTHKLRKHALQSGVFRSIEKKLFLKLGGFNEEKGFSDDRLKTGVKRSRIDDAIFYHDIDSSFKEIFFKQRWIGSSVISNPKSKRFKTKILVFSLIVIGILASFFISKWALLIIPVFLFLLIYKTLKKVFFYKDIRLLVYYPIYLLTYGIAISLGILGSLIKKLFKFP